ncbi:DUF4411 family protein [Pseudomonas plecoglossicida]|uniref:DUF4411 family protein n=1 Tax=Pseudomonas plecoglossicida TaxID=70775 RepID=A0AAD0VUV2_PSEDL|nr:DUF4411 family protein [Pseudomonas plecoglossicida]AXM97590.1 DUF4411 family protein [Pseudomonas plecoglossicida]EPB94911.1 hypothetical protein L321_16888 [Pseudomonas plecoglossicida NB2011]QLB57639.1 DUF4411 family protein [Pseudomonas plecoglossicida]
MKHLLDANTFIEAKNRYYGMKICPAFWQWLLNQNQALELGSITSVMEELAKGNDELAEWTTKNRAFFHSVSDEQTQTAYTRIAAHISEQAPKMKAGALDEFLSGADPWLIAKAISTGATVVTHEVLNLDVKRKFIIPNICENFSVPYMNTFELLHRLEAKFVLQQ